MAALAQLARVAPRLRLPRRTIRLRLTVLYGSLFLASGVVLLAVTYLLVRFTFPTASTHNYLSGHPPTAGSPTPPGLPSLVSLQAQDARQRNADLHHLLIVSAFALAAMVVVSLGLGWVIAGRVLRPLRTITAAARDLSSATLDRRLALAGPDDEIKELGDTFDGLLGRLDRSFASQRQFVANASHELRTPLTLQRALLEAVLNDPDATPASLRRTCGRVLATGADQERLIEALLTLAISERGVDAWEPLNLADIVADVVDERLPSTAQTGLNVHTDLRPAPCMGDADLVERLVANLADNALRYNISGGRVEITTGTDTGQAVVSVANTGPQVPADRIDDLFRPFQRLDASRTGHSDGHGLGLSIVDAVAAAHHAHVDARPGTQGGLDVTVRFPSPPSATADRRLLSRESKR